MDESVENSLLRPIKTHHEENDSELFIVSDDQSKHEDRSSE